MTKISMSNTKKEILAAYEEALKKISDLESNLLKPEKKIEAKKQQAIKLDAKKIVDTDLGKTFTNLKAHLETILNETSSKIAEQLKKYQTMEEAISYKEKELKEIYEIEKTSSTLAALIEAQNDKKAKFESEMADEKKVLEEELNVLRGNIEKEKAAYENELKIQKEKDKQERDRVTEEFQYNFKREKLLAKNKLQDELETQKRKFDEEIGQKQKELAVREADLKAAETELTELRQKVASFDKTLNSTIENTKAETTERVKLNLKHELELKERQFAGDKEVLTTKLASLQEKVKEQSAMIKTLSYKLESSYDKVQNVAMKAIEGASKSNYQGLMKDAVNQKKEEK